jgi:anti-sigma B factor antagonist
MSIRFVKREAGDAVVLEIMGRITLGAGSTTFRELISSIVRAGGKRIVLDLSHVSYIDSSGVGELVSATTTAGNSGAKLVLCHPAPRPMDLLLITKLMAAFEVYSDIQGAITGSKSETPKFFCPVSRCSTWSILRIQADTGAHLCSRCGSRLMLALKGGERDYSSVAIELVEIPTYPGEYLKIILGTPCRAQVVGRLDLFAFNAVTTATATIGRAVFDLTSTQSITPRAANVMAEVLSKGTSVIYDPRGDMPPEVAAAYGKVVYKDESEAIAAHFAAIEKAAREKGEDPRYGTALSTRLLT